MDPLDSVLTLILSFFLSVLTLMNQIVPHPTFSRPIMELENNQPSSTNKGPA